MKKLYMITDLGPGDGGKGGVVHKIAHMQKAHTIVKVGGAQGSHGVRTSNGDFFAFSQFGCGTFEGVHTYISKRFVADPIALLSEAKALEEVGVHHPLRLLHVSADALCSTVFHMAASYVCELQHKDTPRGTIGSGVGQAYRLNESHPELSVHMRDLALPGLRDRLAAIQAHYQNQFADVFKDLDRFKMIDFEYVAEAQGILRSEKFVDALCELMQEFAAQKRIVPDAYLAENVLSRSGVVISESSHGVLTDCYTGFHPHTSALRTLPRFTKALYEDAGYEGEIVSLGVHRAYQIRHGAGPLVTHDAKMSESLLPGSNKQTNRWQGSVRVGPLDLVSLRYALAASGKDAYDGLAITWFDQIEKLGSWRIATHYEDTHTPRFFTKDGNIKVRVGEDQIQLAYLGQLTKKLQAVAPVVSQVLLPFGRNRDELYQLCASTLKEHLGVPVRMVSFGPTERDKVCK
jgi:adenylosuccinate synthase